MSELILEVGKRYKLQVSYYKTFSHTYNAVINTDCRVGYLWDSDNGRFLDIDLVDGSGYIIATIFKLCNRNFIGSNFVIYVKDIEYL